MYSVTLKLHLDHERESISSLATPGLGLKSGSYSAHMCLELKLKGQAGRSSGVWEVSVLLFRLRARWRSGER